MGWENDHEWRAGKDLKGCGCELLEVTVLILAPREEDPTIIKYACSVYPHLIKMFALISS
jgi:hypothetical protein